MEHGTDQPDQQPSLTPQPNQILAEPAAVQACALDFAAAADVRQTLAAQEARAQR